MINNDISISLFITINYYYNDKLLFMIKLPKYLLFLS
jgi:hypothetical protein